MVSQKYRWDFIGLSTDDKPTSETSDKVVNGSTYYCSDTSKLYVYCDGTWYERKPLGGGGGGGTSDFNDLSNRPKYNGSDMTGSTNIPEVKTYTAGSNVAISDQNVISATDTTYSAFTGTDGTAAGTAGLVPAPATTDAGKFLKADGTWGAAGGGGGITELTAADYNYPTNNPTQIAAWLLPDGIYHSASTAIQWSAYGDSAVNGTFIKTTNSSNIAVVFFYRESGLNEVILSQALGSTHYTNLSTSAVKQTTGTSTTDVMSQNATTNAIKAISQSGAGAPTTSTVGTVGQLYQDTTNGDLYICTDATNPYVWEEVGAGGGGGPTVVQTTGTSTTDVMSQNAVTSMVFADPATQYKIKIGAGTSASEGNDAIEIGRNAAATGASSTAIGPCTPQGTDAAKATHTGSIAIGTYAQALSDYSVAIGGKASTAGAVAIGWGSQATARGQFDISTLNTSYGYSNSLYRLISGVHDPVNAHDAATKGYVDPTTDSSAPTTATVGRLGQIQIDTTTATAYMCVAVDTVTPAYTWKQITA